MLASKDIDEHELQGIQPVVQVTDMNAAIAHYRDTLGFGVRRHRGYYWIHVGRDLDGHLYCFAAEAQGSERPVPSRSRS